MEPFTILIALAIFCLRIVDVSFGTLRTISIVSGKKNLSFLFGFFESLVWVFAISQVISRVHESRFLMVIYALGFASGNVVGLYLEEKIGVGISVIRIISINSGEKIAKLIREELHQPTTTFIGEGRDGPVTLIYIMTNSKNVPVVIKKAKEIDPDIFYVVEPAKVSNRMQGLKNIHFPLEWKITTRWKGLFKKKY